MDVCWSRRGIKHAVNLKSVQCKTEEENGATAYSVVVVDKKELTSTS
jgi:hypothetical protein